MASCSCRHCGLPVPAPLQEPDGDSFCCAGCRTVYAMIHGEGLDRFYEMRERQGDELSGRPPAPGQRTYAEFDDVEFQRLYSRPLPAGRMAVDLHVDAIHCAACVWLLERIGQKLPGVAEVRVDLGRSRVCVDWDPTRVQLSAIARHFDKFGYAPEAPRGDGRDEQVRREDRALLLKIAITGAVAGNVMLIAFALYGGALHGMEQNFSDLFRWASLLLTVPAVAWGGIVFFRGAWSALRAGVLHMDLPISIGILAGFVGGAINTITGTGEIYFESVTALIFLLLVGRFLQRRQQRRAAEASQLLYSLAPRWARRVSGDEVQEVPVSALVATDEVEVLAGDVVPADGRVLAGQSNLDVALMTGESRPVAVARDDQILAGTINLTAPLRVRVEQSGECTRVAQLMQLVEESAQRRPRIVKLADRLARWFVTVVLSLAALTAGVWSWLAPEVALDHTIALLVVTCPCALGLATPLAVAAAIGQAARARLLIKGGDVFEKLHQPGVLWLDKTGTLTEGCLRLLSWHGDDTARAALLAVERQSSHPIAVALVRDLASAPAGSDFDGADVTDVEQVLGGGIRATWCGEPLIVGSARFLQEQLPQEALAKQRSVLDDAVQRGHTPILVAIGGKVRGVAALGDALRSSAAATIEQLRQRGWSVGILSGDHRDVVDAVGAELGIDSAVCHGAVTPEEKLRIVEASGADGTATVMVGDGVNDAAALAAASVGVAMHGGAEAALTAADVYLGDGDISSVAELVRGADRTVRVIRRNLLFSLGYNVIGASLAIAGLVHPLVAALLMPTSSLTVIVSSYRARLFVAPRPASERRPAALMDSDARPVTLARSA
ncbi:MAG: heavy metal translocating P-type ATPase [Planctomycetota bacterium]